jgi:hypothetical protein
MEFSCFSEIFGHYMKKYRARCFYACDVVNEKSRDPKTTGLRKI